MKVDPIERFSPNSLLSKKIMKQETRRLSAFDAEHRLLASYSNLNKEAFYFRHSLLFNSATVRQNPPMYDCWSTLSVEVGGGGCSGRELSVFYCNLSFKHEQHLENTN